MTKIIVVSDTHGNVSAIEKLMPRIAENDYFFHLGDGCMDVKQVWKEYPDKVYQCRGNCDGFTPTPAEGELEVEYIKIFYCHGHKYGVKLGLSKLARETKERGCQIALYGHTHNAKITEMDGVTLINPGSLRLPVGEGGSYCYLVVNGDKFTPVIVGESVM
jgi:putative phosphoesterase